MEPLFARDGRKFTHYTFNDKGAPVAYVDRQCWRCGGAGGADKWKPTGWTCYRCGGNGVDPVKETVKLYTEEKNYALDVAQVKRDALRAQIAADKAKREQERADAERSEIISAHDAILKRMRPWLPGVEDAVSTFSGQSFLGEMEEQIVAKARPLSEKQHAAVIRIIERQEAEAARLAKVDFIGEVGERREFILTLGRVFYDRISQFPTIEYYTTYCRTDEGCTVIYKGSSTGPIGHTTIVPPGMKYDDRVYVEGRKVRVMATVKRHYTSNKGEPVTVIQRPKVLEVLAEGDLPVAYRRETE